ncbi:hypothetical protein SESBI_48587 [Sesbania bispinosa]|nr:hypothetical protein SESBI_48587 [Sesbania bispinosa]
MTSPPSATAPRTSSASLSPCSSASVCGALTAATMYLVWSVFSARHDYRAAAYGEFSDDEIESPKKMGYVKIPATEAPAPAPPAKGSV